MSTIEKAIAGKVLRGRLTKVKLLVFLNLERK